MTGAPAEPLRIHTIADREAWTPKPGVVSGLLLPGCVSGVVSAPDLGKSALAADVAGSIAIGKPWFGRKVTAGAALYVAGERGAVTLRRLKAFAAENDVTHLDVGVFIGGLDLLNGDGDVKRILAATRDFEDRTGQAVKLVVLDTLRALMPGDTNNPGDMAKFTRNLGLMRDGAPEAHVMVLHHPPKNKGKEAAGNTAFTAMLDVLLVVSKSKSRGGSSSWEVVKGNDLPPMLPPPALFELHSVTIDEKGHDGEPVTAPVVRPIEQLASSPAAKSTALPPDAKTALNVLERLGQDGALITHEQWRCATFDALGDRKPAAKRQAFSAGRKLLIENGAIYQNGETVSVRITSE